MALIIEQLKKPKVLATTAAAFLATGMVWINCVRQDTQPSSGTNPSTPGILEPSSTPSLYKDNYIKPSSKPSKAGSLSKSEIQKQWQLRDNQKSLR